MRKTLLIVSIAVVMSLIAGYFLGSYMTLQGLKKYAVARDINEAYGYGSALAMLQESKETRVSKCLQMRFMASIEQVNEELGSGIEPYFFPRNLIDGIIMGRDYMVKNGFETEANEINQALLKLEAIHKAWQQK